MKPNAPENVRGAFKPIATNVSGVRISELLPRLAEVVPSLDAALKKHVAQLDVNSDPKRN